MDVHGGVIESDEWAGRNANPQHTGRDGSSPPFSRYGVGITAPKLRQQLQVKSPSGFGPQQGVSPLLFIVGSLRSSAKRVCSAARWLALFYSVKSIVNSSFCICACGTPYFYVTLYKPTEKIFHLHQSLFIHTFHICITIDSSLRQCHADKHSTPWSHHAAAAYSLASQSIRFPLCFPSKARSAALAADWSIGKVPMQFILYGTYKIKEAKQNQKFGE